MSRHTVPGDPASLSACAASVSRVPAWLEPDAAGVRTAYDLLGRDWGGPRSVTVRRGGEGLADATDAVAAQARGVGRALQDYTTELAGLRRQLRHLLDRAETAGLELRGATLEPVFGVLGVADPAAEDARAAARAALTTELATLVTVATRRRERLRAALAESAASLAATSEVLRSGGS